MNSDPRNAALDAGIGLQAGDPAAAMAQARRILETNPDRPDALRLLGRALRQLGNAAEAAQAEGAAIAASLRDPELSDANQALTRGDLALAERILRSRLRHMPDDVVAIMMLADIATRIGILAEAEAGLRRARALAPDYIEAQVSLAFVLFQQRRVDEALALLDRAISANPRHIRAAVSKADMLSQTGDYAGAAATYAALLEAIGDNAEILVGYGNILKTTGRQEDAVSAYRRALAIEPELAEAWWSLAELKAGRIGADDVIAMERVLGRATQASKRVYLHFALGKAAEESAAWQKSFDHYAEGNRLRLALEPHVREDVTLEVDRSIALFDRAFLAKHAGRGAAAADPIFVIGMPRAGSTLLEQILASHPQVEGTAELPYIPQMVQALVAERWRDPAAAYPQVVEHLGPDQIRALGESYLRMASRHRRGGTPFFIDKLPNNWRYIGLIRLILPNARIIDARREPMACGFSNFKQHFARGQTFAYSLTDIGSFYRDYVRLVRHFEVQAPGTIHRVQHEALLDDPETEIRRMLDWLGLPFDARCLRPHENARPVRTASSEQVRRPINRSAVDQWRNYEPWLGELKGALGDMLDPEI
ncbi:MAG: sulfotransferase [Sphingomonas sp.]